MPTVVPPQEGILSVEASGNTCYNDDKSFLRKLPALFERTVIME